MSRAEFNVPPSRSWRDIPQQVKPRAMSKGGRKRLVWSVTKTIFAGALLCGLVWGGYEIGAVLRGNPRVLSATAEAVPVKEIVLTTDGVLDHEWVVKTLGLPRKVSLMQLDLHVLQAKLLETRQVRTANVARVFPATLTVSISEYSPVARLMAQVGRDEPQAFLVSREGVVFEGFGFDPAMVKTLPWLAGVKLERDGEGFLPIAHMEVVADLLAKAKLEAEHLYRTWHVISMERFESDHEIEVRAKDVGRILFGVNDDFFRQLARLDSLLDAARARTDRPLREVNLAIGAQVPVTFEDPELVPGVAAPANVRATTAEMRRERTPARPAFLDFQRNNKL